VPADAAALLAALPDTGCWVETRALLLSGRAVVRGSAAGDSAVVLDPALPSGFLVGRGDAAFLREVLASVPQDFELVVQEGAIDAARAALAGWTFAPATVFSRAAPWPLDAAQQPDVIVSAPPEERWLRRIPQAGEMRFYAALAEAIALRVAGDEVVAVCAAGDVTETLWDVGIDTVEGARRQGHAAAAFGALAAHMAAAGKQPVWCAEDANEASMAMAARLGFEPVGRIGILRRV
jgi:RimJ/RimL family protein N-acetyltransferase